MLIFRATKININIGMNSERIPFGAMSQCNMGTVADTKPHRKDMANTDIYLSIYKSDTMFSLGTSLECTAKAV